MGSTMKNYLLNLIYYTDEICQRISKNGTINDLLFFNEVELTYVIIGLQRLIEIGGVL